MKDERRITILQMDYNKLLAFVAAGMVSFFTLFQILFQLDDIGFVNPWHISIVSTSVFLGIILFTLGGYHNFTEIRKIERGLKFDEIDEYKPSGIFSGRGGISYWLYIIVLCFWAVSFMIYYNVLIKVLL